MSNLQSTPAGSAPELWKIGPVGGGRPIATIISGMQMLRCRAQNSPFASAFIIYRCTLGRTRQSVAQGLQP